MNILILAPYAGSDKHGMIYRNYALAKAFGKLGHHVTIVTSSYSHTRVVQPVTKGRVVREIIDDIEYIWLWGPKYQQGKTIGRVISMIVYTVQCLLLKLKKPFDIVIASSPHPFTIYPARRLVKRWEAKLIYDIRDLWPLTLIQLGGKSAKHPFIWLMQQAENYACKYADLVIAVPGNCENYLIQHGLKAGRFLHISNGVSEGTEFSNIPVGYSDFLKNLKKDGNFIVGYTGAIGFANAMHSIVSALPYVSSKIHLVILGDGSYKESIETLAEKCNISEQVHILAPVRKTQVNDFLKYVNVAYAGVRYNKLYAYGASLTKLSDYMMASKPILYSVGDQGNPVEKSGCGITCEAENTHQIAAALNIFFNMLPQELDAMGELGRNWCLKNQMVTVQANAILNELTN